MIVNNFCFCYAIQISVDENECTVHTETQEQEPSSTADQTGNPDETIQLERDSWIYENLFAVEQRHSHFTKCEIFCFGRKYFLKWWVICSLRRC